MANQRACRGAEDEGAGDHLRNLPAAHQPHLVATARGSMASPRGVAGEPRGRPQSVGWQSWHLTCSRCRSKKTNAGERKITKRRGLICWLDRALNFSIHAPKVLRINRRFYDPYAAHPASVARSGDGNAINFARNKRLPDHRLCLAGRQNALGSLLPGTHSSGP